MSENILKHNMWRNLCHWQWKRTATSPRDKRMRSTDYTRCPDPSLPSKRAFLFEIVVLQCCITVRAFVLWWSGLNLKWRRLLNCMNRTLLWYMTSSSHKNSINRNDALQRISDGMECSIQEVVKKLRTLRSQYFFFYLGAQQGLVKIPNHFQSF